MPVRLSHLVSLTRPRGLDTAAWSLPLPGTPPTGHQKSPGNRVSKEIIIAAQITVDVQPWTLSKPFLWLEVSEVGMIVLVRWVSRRGR